MATIRSGSSTAKGRLEEELERSREDLEDFFENGTVALHWVAADGSILRVNQAELDLLGYKREEYVGRHIAEFHADPPVIQDILARLTRGEKLDKYEARLKAKDGSIKYVLISSNVRFREGRFINTRCFSLDVTELKKLENALRESEQRLRATHDHAFAGIAEVALDGRFLRSNARFHQLTGYSVAELSHLTIKDVTHPEDSSEDADKFGALVVGKIDTYQAEKRFLTKNGAVIWVALSASLVRDEGGQPLYGIRVAQDISALKHAQTRQKLLLDELNHRVNNMLATVQSVVMHTRRSARTIDEFTTAFEGRLMALNRAHHLLTREIGTGVFLHDLIHETLAQCEGKSGVRFRLEGPPIRLGSQVAGTLAMALHELTTNAKRYGALSSPQGRINVEWRTEKVAQEPERMVIEWTELDGPPVANPTRLGFGVDLIQRGLARQFGARASLDFRISGLRCRIMAPLPQAEDWQV